MNNTEDLDGGSRPTLGVVAICRNEESDLPGFLENFLPWVDEIIIVDDGSTDNSVSIVRDAGSKVRLIQQIMDAEAGFSGQRNLGIEHSTADWLIHTDIDERSTPAFAKEIMTRINGTGLHGFSYSRRNFFLNRAMLGGGMQDWVKPQLARRGMHRFRNRVHEECVIEGGEDKIGQLQNAIWHLNDKSYRDRIEKSVVYCQEQARRIARRGITVRWWHLLCFPMAEFAKKYVLKAGFRDGVPGLIWSLHASCAIFKATALVWDEQNKLSRKLLEDELKSRWDAAS